jgi:hypothetical protein
MKRNEKKHELKIHVAAIISFSWQHQIIGKALLKRSVQEGYDALAPYCRLIQPPRKKILFPLEEKFEHHRAMPATREQLVPR